MIMIVNMAVMIILMKLMAIMISIFFPVKVLISFYNSDRQPIIVSGLIRVFILLLTSQRLSKHANNTDARNVTIMELNALMINILRLGYIPSGMFY